MNRSLLLSTCLLLGFLSAMSQELPRRAFLGVSLGLVTEDLQNQLQLPEAKGAYINQVFDASSAKAAGLEAADVLVKLGKEPVANSQEFIRLIKAYNTGDKVAVEFYRKGKKQGLDLTLMGFPEERYEGATMKYSSIKTANGINRSIISLPKGKANPPVVYIIQGIGCGSVDVTFSPQSGMAQLVKHFTDQGFATYRVEKSGVGDSKGKACSECDFLEDKEVFLEGLKELKELSSINAEEIYLLGLSMGGVWAPMIANEIPVKGVMAYGTISRPFMEYMLENTRRQAVLAGEDYSEIEETLKQDLILFNHMVNDNMSPAQIAEKFPDLEARLQEFSTESDPKAEIRHIHAGRLYTFQVQLQQTNLSEVWKNVDAHVLAVWGKGDYVSNREDHELIRDIVNRYHPGKASFAEVEADHWFQTAISEQDAYAKRNAPGNPPLNPEVFETFSNWIQKIRGV